MWCIQVQLLLQIIINRICLIVPDRNLSRRIMIATAGIVTAINISVFCIWVPARIQVNHTYVQLLVRTKAWTKKYQLHCCERDLGSHREIHLSYHRFWA